MNKGGDPRTAGRLRSLHGAVHGLAFEVLDLARDLMANARMRAAAAAATAAEREEGDSFLVAAV